MRAPVVCLLGRLGRCAPARQARRVCVRRCSAALPCISLNTHSLLYRRARGTAQVHSAAADPTEPCFLVVACVSLSPLSPRPTQKKPRPPDFVRVRPLLRARTPLGVVCGALQRLGSLFDLPSYYSSYAHYPAPVCGRRPGGRRHARAPCCRRHLPAAAAAAAAPLIPQHFSHLHALGFS